MLAFAGTGTRSTETHIFVTFFLNESTVLGVAGFQAEAHQVCGEDSEDVFVAHDEVGGNAVGSSVLFVHCEPLLWIYREKQNNSIFIFKVTSVDASLHCHKLTESLEYDPKQCRLWIFFLGTLRDYQAADAPLCHIRGERGAVAGNIITSIPKFLERDANKNNLF